MAGLITPTIWTRQPQFPSRIDWQDPISRGLAFAANAGAGFHDALTGRIGTQNGVSVVSESRHGRSYDAASNASIGASWSGSRLSTSTGNGQGDFTVLVLSNPVASSTREMLFSVTNGSTEFYLAANANVSLTAASGTVTGNTNSGGPNGVAVAGAVDGNWHTYAYGRTGGATGTGKLWVDGVASSAVIVANAAMWSSTSANNIGGYTGANWGISGQVPLALAWNRLLDDAEIAALTRNPWQIFQPLQRRVFVGVPSSGLNISATLGTAAADGATAAVDRQLAIAATLGTATASGSTASVDRQLAIAATLGAATASGADATIDRQLTITATIGAATADGATATIGSGLAVQATLGAADAAGLTALIDLQYEVAATLGAAAASGYTATIGTGTSGGTGATVEEIWSYEIEPGVTAAAAMRRILAMLCGKVSGAGTDTEVFRDVNDTRNAVTVTVDASGNRSAISFDDGP